KRRRRQGNLAAITKEIQPYRNCGMAVVTLKHTWQVVAAITARCRDAYCTAGACEPAAAGVSCVSFSQFAVKSLMKRALSAIFSFGVDHSRFTNSMKDDTRSSGMESLLLTASLASSCVLPSTRIS